MKEHKTTGMGQLTFTNGVTEITATGSSIEDAFVKLFDKIDEFHNN